MLDVESFLGKSVEAPFCLMMLSGWFPHDCLKKSITVAIVSHFNLKWDGHQWWQLVFRLGNVPNGFDRWQLYRFSMQFYGMLVYLRHIYEIHKYKCQTCPVSENLNHISKFLPHNTTTNTDICSRWIRKRTAQIRDNSSIVNRIIPIK